MFCSDGRTAPNSGVNLVEEHLGDMGYCGPVTTSEVPRTSKGRELAILRSLQLIMAAVVLAPCGGHPRSSTITGWFRVVISVFEKWPFLLTRLPLADIGCNSTLDS